MKTPEELLKELTLEEKASLCDGSDYWHLQGIPEKGIPEIMVCDGPHGLRKKDYDKTGASLTCSVPSICFPTAVTTACSWDPELMYEMGVALGKKCQKEKVGVLLGPGVNMKRSPLCGRNFEYFSEDPVLAGEIAAGLINGVQSQGVGTSLKHFAVNSQETRRMTVSAVVDERALREVYLTAFEIAVKKAKPWTVMSSYNRINGVHASENRHTLTEILRDEWGYDGTVVSDWGGINDRVYGVESGNDLEMPSSFGSGKKKIIEAVESGKLDEAVLDKAVLNILNLIRKASENAKEDYKYNDLDDQSLARKIAGRSMVLMKNNGILPLAKDKKIAVIGEFAKIPRYQGAGSSQINPTKIDCAYDELLSMGYDLEYAQGYERSAKKEYKNPPLIREAVELAERCDVAVVFVGLTDDYESEGYDRYNMGLPASHNELVYEVTQANPNTVVVLAGGSPVEIPWNDRPGAILNTYLGGQAVGGATADILSGAVNPSGKLAETYPVFHSDTPAVNYYPGSEATTEHRESIYIGYRYYEKAGREVRYPFGHGLSYTSFEYSDITLDKQEMNDSDKLTVSFSVENTGKVAGYETAQLYVADKESTVFRPVKELKGFKKVWLEPGEKKNISITLCKRAFAFYNTVVNDWTVEAGEFDILVGASCADIRLTATVKVNAAEVEMPDYRETAPAYYTAGIQNVPDEQFAAVLGHDIPSPVFDPASPVTIADNFESARRRKNGEIMYRLVCTVVPEGFARSIATQVPFRDMISMSGGVFNESMAQGLCEIINSEKGGVRRIAAGLPNALKGIGPLLKQI